MNLPTETSSPSLELEAQAAFLHDAVDEWLAEPGITVACGRWARGAISELMPSGRGRLLPARYPGCFAGVRELRIDDAPHHLHIDLGRVHRLSYAVAPSVCLAFRPSFEARLLVLGAGGAPTDDWVVSLVLTSPYRGSALDREAVKRFFLRVRHHAASRPDLVEVSVDSAVRVDPVAGEILEALREAIEQPNADWATALAALQPALTSGQTAATVAIDPPCVPLLTGALALADASLVIYRDRTLVEFKTEKLDGVHRYVEDGHVSWQIGALHDHHCHLSLGAVDRVLFSAEPVPCQGGGLNYTIWFLSAGPSGNPYRRDGYFSIVLNRPYTGTAPRLEVIQPVLRLFERFRHEPWVDADAAFLRVLAEGPPARPFSARSNHAAP